MSNSPNLKARRGTRAVIEQRPAWWKSPLPWIGGILAIALIATIAIGVANRDGSSATGETAFAEIIGPALPALTSPDPAIGTQAPSVSAMTLDGVRFEPGQDGVARIYGFFAHWCPHCQAELPRVAEWVTNNPLPDGVELLAVSTSVDDARDNYPPSEWFAREGWPGTVLLDSAESSLGAGFGLTAFPYWVAVDADGSVVARLSGELDDATIDALVTTLATP